MTNRAFPFLSNDAVRLVLLLLFLLFLFLFLLMLSTTEPPDISDLVTRILPNSLSSKVSSTSIVKLTESFAFIELMFKDN